jgi:hypothetical protein
MSNLADTFPYTGPVTNPSYPAYTGTTAPANPTIGTIWFNPTGRIMQVFTARGWQTATGGGGTAGGRLVDLTDVDAMGSLDGDILVFDSTSSTWQAVALDLDYGRY